MGILSLDMIGHPPARPMRRWVAFGVSTVFHALGLAGVIILGILVPSKIERVSTNPPPAYIHIQIPARPPVEAPIRLPQPRVQLSPPKAAPPKIEAHSVPPLPRLPNPEPRKVATTVAPLEASRLAAPLVRTEPKRQLPPVQPGVPGGRSETATVKLPRREVQTGGFGTPNGLPGEAQGGSLGNVAKLGSFDLPPGEGYGNGSGGTHGARGTVASAGFGSGIAGTGGGGVGRGGSGREGAQPSGFDVKPVAPAPTVQRSLPQRPPLTPVEILFKPNPVYTDEARRLGLQGEVVLSVIFAASGELRVLRVVQGLGHGLDEAAWRAAEQIRFKPAMRDGQPVDFPAALRVTFQLAG